MFANKAKQHRNAWLVTVGIVGLGLVASAVVSGPAVGQVVLDLPPLIPVSGFFDKRTSAGGSALIFASYPTGLALKDTVVYALNSEGNPIGSLNFGTVALVGGGAALDLSGLTTGVGGYRVDGLINGDAPVQFNLHDLAIPAPINVDLLDPLFPSISVESAADGSATAAGGCLTQTPTYAGSNGWNYGSGSNSGSDSTSGGLSASSSTSGSFSMGGHVSRVWGGNVGISGTSNRAINFAFSETGSGSAGWWRSGSNTPMTQNSGGASASANVQVWQWDGSNWGIIASGGTGQVFSPYPNPGSNNWSVGGTASGTITMRPTFAYAGMFWDEASSSHGDNTAGASSSITTSSNSIQWCVP